MKNKNRKLSIKHLLFFGGVLLLLLFFPLPNLAQPNIDTGLDYVEQTGLTKKDPRLIIVDIIRIFLGFLGIIVLILIIYAGFLWMTAGGESEKVDKAKTILKNAIIGLLIILSSYAIVSFILSKLGGNGGVGPAGNSGNNTSSYFSALGESIIESHYPARGQKDVPRNTKIVVTFRQEIEAAGIIRNLGACGETICGDLNYDNVKIFRTDAQDFCKSEEGKNDNSGKCATNVSVQTADNKTFVFRPKQYLGVESGNVNYAVYLGSGLKRKDGKEAFGAGGNYQWNFEVSNKLDLIPPQVESVFPYPDNLQDEKDISPAIEGEWKLALNNENLPKAKIEAAVLGIINNKTDEEDSNVTVTGTYAGEEDGIFKIVIISEDGELKASVSFNNKASVNKKITDNKFSLWAGGSRELQVGLNAGEFVAGDSWDIKVKAGKNADFLAIGTKNYYFGQEIQMAGDAAGLLNSMGNAINEDASSPVTVLITANFLDLKAKISGKSAAQSIVFSASDENKIKISVVKEGVDRGAPIVKDLSDQPINAVIQINFNEAIDPLMLRKIFVKNAVTNLDIAGEFLISNQYKTAEFKPSVSCGKNSCGEEIFCLPANTNIELFAKAAKLRICNDNSDCPDPSFSCGGAKVCKNDKGVNYPLSESNTGIMDMSDNSLDGNKNTLAEGPQEQSGKDPYNQNENNSRKKLSQENPGDDYKWKFWTSDILDLTAPKIISRTPNQDSQNITLDTPVTAQFDKLMMSSSLGTGFVQIGNDVHNKINLNSNNANPVSYWIEKQDLDAAIKDGYEDQTEVKIMHDQFQKESSYSSDVGSGVKDIYQNCYNPSQGPFPCDKGCNN